MTERKARLTVTVDRALLDAGNAAVESGLADSLSGWVNTALFELVEKQRRLRALAEAIAAYEAEFGAITQAEVDAQQRADREEALLRRRARAQRQRSKRKRA